MHYVYLSLYYLSLVMMWIAGLAAGILFHWTVWVLICRVFATDAKEAANDKMLERAGFYTIIALIVFVFWFLVNKLAATLGGINAL